MDKFQIVEVLDDWNFWKHKVDTGVLRRGYLDKAFSSLESDVIVSFIGVRRSGKSTLMRQLAEKLIHEGIDSKDVVTINFEDSRFTDLSLNLIEDVFNVYLELVKPVGKPFVFLDEVNKINDWEKWVRSFHELKKGKVIVSGSSADLLDGELSSLLTGRHLDVFVFPLSFKEFLYFKGLKVETELDAASKRIELKRLFNEYMEFGGFPAVVLTNDPVQKRTLLLTYFEDIINKDIEKRYKVRKGIKLKALAKFYLSNVSSPVTFNSLKKFLDLSTTTIEKFSSYLSKAYLTFFVPRFSFKLKEQEKAPRKVYCVDVGMANAVGFKFSEMRGAIHENLVALEFEKMRRKNSIEFYYWQDVQGHEVDFIIKKGLKISQLVQVTAISKKEELNKRELKSLIKASEELNCNNLLVLTRNYENTEEVKGKKIKFIPLWKWLLKVNN